MIINLSGIDFGGVATGGGNAKPEETFDVQPTTAEQTITPTAGSVFSGGTVHAVTKEIDNNIVPENIKEGVSILGVVGTLSEGGGGSSDFVLPNGIQFIETITEIPSNIDASRMTSTSLMFENCINLTTIPSINTSGVIDMSNMFYGCTGLTAIPLLNTSSVTNMNQMFYNCNNLKTIPPLDLSSVTHINRLFANCHTLTTIPPLDTSKVTAMSAVFTGCSKLTTVEGIDFSGLTSSPSKMLGKSPYLTRFIVNGKINVSITSSSGFTYLTKIDYDSVKSILAAADRTDNTDVKELVLSLTMTDQNGELAALVSSCTSKGWTITGLTLN